MRRITCTAVLLSTAILLSGCNNGLYKSSSQIYGSLTQHGYEDIHIQFDRDATKVRPSEYKQLEELSKAMHSIELDGRVYMLIGHTDSSGSDSYNKSLSKRRAQSVKNYLVKEHGINGADLYTTGKGEEELLVSPEKNDYDSSLNRRVQVRLTSKNEAMASR
ncbi:MAG: OmpA family protein [Marinobacterium sp.]|nr:OmpA family protein [Marinobacterium sp.]